jgi:dihydropteroate synthase
VIDLAGLARLAAEHPDELATLDRPLAPLCLGGRDVDTDTEPVVMGVVNLSRDSSYRDSVCVSVDSAVRRGLVLAAQGAHVVDVGAESSNAASARVAAQEQARSLEPVLRELSAAGVVCSVEGYDADVVRAGLDAGASVVNLTGSSDDAAIFDLAAERDATVVLCHVHGRHARDLDGDGRLSPDADPVPAMVEAFARRLDDARARGVSSLAIDPGLGLGFALDDQRARARHQTAVLLQTFRLRTLGVPVCHSLPHSFELFEDQFRSAEAFFTVLARIGGTGVYRTHEVPQIAAVLGALAALG